MVWIYLLAILFHFYIRWMLLLTKYCLLINIIYLNYLVLIINFTYVKYHLTKNNIYWYKKIYSDMEEEFINRKRYIQISKKNSSIILFVWNLQYCMCNSVYYKVRGWEIVWIFYLLICTNVLPMIRCFVDCVLFRKITWCTWLSLKIDSIHCENSTFVFSRI